MVRSDVAFHYEIVRIVRNPVFNAFHDVLVEWLIGQRTTTISLPDADRLSLRDHTAICAAVASRDPARAYHEMASHLRLISRLYDEATRLRRDALAAGHAGCGGADARGERRDLEGVLRRARRRRARQGRDA